MNYPGVFIHPGRFKVFSVLSLKGSSLHSGTPITPQPQTVKDDNEGKQRMFICIFIKQHLQCLHSSGHFVRNQEFLHCVFMDFYENVFIMGTCWTVCMLYVMRNTQHS